MPICKWFCVDGSASKPQKRPLYVCDVTGDGQGKVDRCRLGNVSLAIFLKQQVQNLRQPILLAVDVPIGLPEGYPEVWDGKTNFREWLIDKTRDGRKPDLLVSDSVGHQSAAQPFCKVQKGEAKEDGHFPKRQCEERTGGESLYWCVGGKQVGRAALQFWFETLSPLVQEFGNELALWPFDDITDKHRIVIAECYPAIFYERVWGAGVTKTNPLEVVDVIYAAKKAERFNDKLASEKVLLHAASSEDEFDMFTTVMAISENLETLLKGYSEDSQAMEGWMIGLGAN